MSVLTDIIVGVVQASGLQWLPTKDEAGKESLRYWIWICIFSKHTMVPNGTWSVRMLAGLPGQMRPQCFSTALQMTGGLASTRLMCLRVLQSKVRLLSVLQSIQCVLSLFYVVREYHCWTEKLLGTDLLLAKEDQFHFFPEV